jgi:hypothetical protein
MTVVSDETLMAYADGELSTEETRQLDALLDKSPELRARLEPFALTGSSLADVFDQPMREPVPERLLALIEGHKSSKPPRTASASSPVIPGEVTSFLNRALAAAREFLLPDGLPLGGAVAATALLIAVGTGGYLAGRSGGEDIQAMAALKDGVLVAGGALHTTLERVPSGAEGNTGVEGLRIVPIQTFHDRTARVCREYEMVNKAGKRFGGIACRVGEGAWQVAVHSKIGGANGYATASEAQSPTLSAARTGLMSGTYLSAAEEDALRASGWDRGQ